MMINNDKNAQKRVIDFFCECCNYRCSRKLDFERHLSTRKHKMMTNNDKNAQKSAQVEFVCECGKRYRYRQGLSVHKKNCKVSEPKLSSLVDSNYKINAETILELFKQNKELQKHIMTINMNMMQTNKK